jgi:protein-histidine pros-kinase
VLTVIATTALVRNQRQRAETAAELQRRRASRSSTRAAELTDWRSTCSVQEEEQARLARPARRTGGVPLAARMDVTWMQHAAGDDADVKMRLERLKQVLDQGIELKRRVVEELRPTLLDTMGLLAALRWQSEETCRRADLRCTERFLTRSRC